MAKSHENQRKGIVAVLFEDDEMTSLDPLQNHRKSSKTIENRAADVKKTHGLDELLAWRVHADGCRVLTVSRGLIPSADFAVLSAEPH